MIIENVTIEVYLPTIQKYFDFTIPLNCRLREVKLLIGKILESYSEYSYIANENSMLFDKKNGYALNEELTVQELDIMNGSKLFYI